MISNFFTLYANAYKRSSSPKTISYEFFVVESCISLNMHLHNASARAN